MTGLVKPNQFATGQLVYNALGEKQKSRFQILNVSADIWGICQQPHWSNL